MAKSLLLKNVISVDKGVLMIDTTNNCVFELTDIDCPDNIKLTRRQKQVFQLIAHGLKDTSIANTLHISPRTVTTYVEQVRRLTGCPSRAAAMYLVTSLGLLEEE